MLAIVPARGGSRGVVRKNVRALNGKPLLLHALDTLRRVPDVTRIVVSTEDPEIAAIARLHGYEVADRPPRLAEDTTTIAEVTQYTAELLDWSGEVGVFQPTSPTLRAVSIVDAIRQFRAGGYASLCSVTADTKLRWSTDGPLFTERRNRQYAEPEYRETGAIQLTRDARTLIGDPHHLYELPAAEAHDIDTLDDLETCRRALSRKRITFHLAASRTLGAGHLYRALAIADELAHHDVAIDAFGSPKWVTDLITARGYPLFLWAEPDLVISDTLDTTTTQVAAWKSKGASVVTLEDLGPGSDLADLVVNELYADPRPHVETGPRWSVLRPEFLSLPPRPTREEGRKVLVLFGGTDPAHLSERVSWCAAGATVLLGPGAEPGEFAPNTEVHREACVAELVREHDLVVTSAGRTVHEVAACGVPVVSIAANERETRHSHCAGVLRLGLHAALSDDQIRECIERLLAAPDLRDEMATTARGAIDGLGTARIRHRVEGLLQGL